MAKDGKSTLIPRRRFPAFLNAPDWKDTPLSSIADPVIERAEAGDGSQVLTLSGEQGIILQSEYFGKQVAGTNSERYTKIARNDFVYNDRTTKLSAYGTIKRLSSYEGGIVSPIYKCFRFCARENPVFWDFYFESGIHDAELKGLINEGARAGRFNISIDKFLSTTGWRPERDEQKKIADCLTSLGEVIAAQARKVQALKTHKRGLMQHLFPREGETLPRLRFPEFRDMPEWKEAKLNRLGTLVSGLTYSPTDVQDDGLLVLRSSNIQNAEVVLDDCVYVNPDINGVHLSKPNDILICVRNGSKALIGKSAMIPESMPLCTHGAFMTVFRSHAPLFVFQLMQSAAFHKQVAADLGATINSINGGQLLKYRFVVPEPDEQNQIAECLSSLSAQIAAESERLDVLKTHKQGLMHQLFPSPEED